MCWICRLGPDKVFSTEDFFQKALIVEKDVNGYPCFTDLEGNVWLMVRDPLCEEQLFVPIETCGDSVGGA